MNDGATRVNASDTASSLNVIFRFVTGQIPEPEPEFLAPLENHTVTQGRDVYFYCVVNNLGTYKDCHINLQRLATTNRVKLRWIYRSLDGKELADSLAQQSSELGLWPARVPRRSRMFVAERTDRLTSNLLNLNRRQTWAGIGALTLAEAPTQNGTYKRSHVQTLWCGRRINPPCTCYCEGLARCRPWNLGKPFMEPKEKQESPVNSLPSFVRGTRLFGDI
ncbi:hypothetical protein NQ317_009910 [Molorchus minor]|uniref:Ig-like domain-containing protein n=1 Tax=Molorchus minor TaxID=1323400 RepID=A0ABQ9K7V0_9CUCU|nr:hypothetical protein NQ317_009910 [Molorchus minor]